MDSRRNSTEPRKDKLKHAINKAVSMSLLGGSHQVVSGTHNKPLIIVKDTTRSEEAGRRYSRSKETSNSVKPADQLALTESELREDIPRMLTVDNPNAPQNIIRFSFKERRFKPTPFVDQTHIHLELIGNLILKGSAEAKQYEEERAERDNCQLSYYSKNLIDEYTDADDRTCYRILKNRINYNERAAQTFNNPMRDAEMITEPPETVTFSAQATQYIIFAAYSEDFSTQQKLKEKKPINKQALDRIQTARKKRVESPSKQINEKLEETYRMLTSVKMIERMISQNVFDEIMQDFKYYDDEADFYKREGSLLPLWKFSNQATKNMCITSICWNPKYLDLFAISCGSYDFFERTKGHIVLYSLKNPSFFEMCIETESGCLSIDFHAEHSYLLAAGFYDGSVNVFDLRPRAKREPKFQSTHRADKHKDPVWQVQWQKDDPDGNINFCSISADGRVVNWTIKSGVLFSTDIVTLNQPMPEQTSQKTPEQLDDEVFQTDIDCNMNSGTCFDFNTKQENLFIVGTEDGKVLEYSTMYSNQQLLTAFEAHCTPIYTIKWNTFLKRIFITCSADWMVKVWDYRYKDPIFSYDLNAVVSDVAWAPYSSTVFAAVTVDGNVHFYDISVDKFEPLCMQNILGANKRARKLTKVSFGPNNYIILVADDKGSVSSLKMSPNLRSIPRDSKNNPISILHKENYELTKMSKLIASEIDASLGLAKTTRKYFNFDEKMKVKKKNKHDEVIAVGSGEKDKKEKEKAPAPGSEKKPPAPPTAVSVK